ncbi:MAG: hypothetical protein J6Y89_08575, partial [Lachnospiraceae bacterium]|nr:hypothetical protein [Lachnospiraceae bacterium]
MKRIKGLFAIVLFGMILLITGNNTVRAEYYEFNFSFSDTIRGTAGEVLSGQIYTINLGSTPLVRPLPQGADISSWFSGSTSPKPAGMQVVVYEEAEVGARSLKVEFKGKVLGASRDTVTMRVPLPYFVADQTNYSYVCDVKVSGGGKYNIVRNFTAPSGYMGVGHGIYFDKSQNGGNGFKLTGEKGVALPANGCELNVVIDGCFIRKVDAGKDITSWFTGHVIAQNMTYNTSLNSQLPPGITVKIKNTVKVGDNSFTMVFSGTPTKGSKDIIAITIPAGYVTYNPGAASDYMGDLQDALKTYNASGHFVYDIFSSDNDYKSVYVMATYPDATIHAGSIYTEEDGLEITYQLVGTNANGVPYRFKNISVGSNFKGYIVENAYNGTCPETITMHTGLTPEVTYVSEDGSIVKATIVGTAKKTNSLSLLISSGAFMQLNSSFSTYGNFVDFVASEDTHLYFGQPDPQITVSNDITIESTFFDETPTISETTFTINLGNDTLARSFTKGDNLQLFAYKSSSDPETSLTNPEKQWTTRENWNNLYLQVAENASAGSREIKVNLYSAGAIETDYYGYLYLALPRSYLTNATAYGSDGQYEQASYPIENSRIFLNVEKYENYYAKASDVRLEGYFHRGYLYVDILQEDETEESGYRVVGRDRKEYFDGGIGKGKVSFTIETLQDINVGKDYAAGASVKDLIRLNRMTLETSPFQNNIGDHPVFYQYWENYYDIHTAKAISKDNEGEEKAHVFELYFDLSEIQAQQPSNTKIILEIFDGKNWKTVYTSNRCVFDIDGEIFETYDEKEYAEYKRKYNYQAGSSASDG